MSVRLHCWRNCERTGNGQAERPASSAAPSARAVTATKAEQSWTRVEAEAYHRAQITAFVEGGADMVTAYDATPASMKRSGSRARSKLLGIPAAHLVHGGNQRPSGEGRDAAARRSRPWIARLEDRSEYFLINCAHPTHFADALKAGEAWTERIHGVAGQCLDEEPCRARRIRNARIQVTRSILGGVT